MKDILILSFVLVVAITPGLVHAQQWETNNLGIHYDEGRVGIGTTDPLRELHVQGDAIIKSGAGAELNLHNESSGVRWQVVSGYSSGLEIGNVTDGLIDGAAPFYIQRNGNVGIGTTSPSSRMHIRGGDYDFSEGGDLRVGSSTDALKVGVAMGGNGSGNTFITTEASSSNGDIRLGTRGATTQLVLDASRRHVGIGVANPATPLHVREGKRNIAFDPANMVIKLWRDGWDEERLLDWGWTETLGDYVRHHIPGAGPNPERMTLSENQGVLIEGMRVGIGTAAPDEKLSVNGRVKAKEVIVALDGWSDFVFDEDYPLATLEEVRAYIEENGHLPNVPSAEEVEQDGVQLGQMDARLLQKIEELTLYAIEREEQVEGLRKECAAQQKHVERLQAQTRSLQDQVEQLQQQNRKMKRAFQRILGRLEGRK